MDVISELDTLCIVARELYGERGVVLASSEEPRPPVAAEQVDELSLDVVTPKLGLEAAEIVWEA